MQLLAAIGVALLNVNSDIINANKDKKNQCAMQNIALQLNALPPSVILTTSSAASELLYRTHHKVIAGNYHHNVEGLLDVHRALLDTEPWETAKKTLRKRNIEYILVCQSAQDAVAEKPRPTIFYNWLANSNPISGIEPIELNSTTKTTWLLFQTTQPQNHD